MSLLLLFHTNPLAYTLAIDMGAYIETGQGVTLKATRTFPAAVGAYTESGQVVLLKRGLKTTAGVGAYSESGQSVGLFKNSKIPAAVGSYTLNGQVVLLKQQYHLSILVADFMYTRKDVNFSLGVADWQAQAAPNTNTWTKVLAALNPWTPDARKTR